MALDLIPTVEAARLLGVSDNTVQRLVESGKLPEAAKAPGLRGARFFLRSDVAALVEERMKPVTAESGGEV